MIKTLNAFWLIPWIIIQSIGTAFEMNTPPAELGLRHGRRDLHRWFGPRYRPRPPTWFSGREAKDYRAAYEDAWAD